MKILIIQSNGKHPENIRFREASCLCRSFRCIGMQAECWGPGYPLFSESFERVAADADVVFVTENYDRSGWIPDLSSCESLKIFWSIDAHVVLKRHVEFCDRNGIDVVLSSTERYLRNFNVEKKHWFPNCYPSDLFDAVSGAQKTQDVGFCGNINNRGPWLNAIGVTPDVMVLGEEMIRKIASYRIHWNRGIRDDINYRVFETLGAGTFLLTNRTAGLEKLFVDGRHLVTYANGGDCVEKVAYYLSHESEREKIAAAGRAHAKRNHTYDVRASQFIDIVKGCV